MPGKVRVLQLRLERLGHELAEWAGDLPLRLVRSLAARLRRPLGQLLLDALLVGLRRAREQAGDRPVAGAALQPENRRRRVARRRARSGRGCALSTRTLSLG